MCCCCLQMFLLHSRVETTLLLYKTSQVPNLILVVKNCRDGYASVVRVRFTPKCSRPGALSRGSLMFSVEVSGQIIDGVMYFRKWCSVRILSLGKSIRNLTLWSAEINLCRVELLRPSTLCAQDADLCHFFLTVSFSPSFFSVYNPDHINVQNINRDLQRIEMAPLHKGKGSILTQKLALKKRFNVFVSIQTDRSC